MSRERTTWTADRKASAAPATPGYGTEDQGHPAHKPDPAYEAYKNGDPSAWAEDPTPPPYLQGNPPADPGYDVEDQDHPAHMNPPRVPKEATMSLKAMVERKATKAIKVARLVLGCGADQDLVEETAVDLMDLPDDSLNSMYARFGGGFLAEEQEEVPNEDIAALLAEAEEEDEDPVMARIKAMEEELASLKAASTTKKAEDEEAEEPEEKPEEAKAKKDEEKTAAVKTAKGNFQAMLASMDTDNDGFLMASDWAGNKAMFASLDTDKDGIVSVEEAAEMFFAQEDPEEVKAEMEIGADQNDPHAFKADDCDESGMFSMTSDPMGLDETPEEDAMLDEIFGCKTAKKDGKKDGKKVEEEEDDIELEAEEKEDEKKAGKKASTLNPQRPKVAKGPKTLGSQTRVAANVSTELSDLWDSDPDVNAVFGLPSPK